MNDCLHLRKNESYQEFSQISGFERLFFIESIAGITLLAILLLAGSAVAKTITVDDTPGADYFRIQDAVDNATAEDTMLVYSGTYYENVNVNKQLVLRGIDNGGGKPILNANGNDSAITMSAGNSVLEGFKVVNAYDYSYDYGYAGIYIGSNRNIIRNNTVSNNWNGIFLVSSSNNTLINNTISNNSQGIDLLYSSNNMVIKNNVSNNSYYGIALESLPDLTAHSTNNTIYNNFFNNINNLVIRDSAVNTWNITKTESPNIINGSYLGGNVWANPGGTGFSQTCTDSDRDGICDSNYSVFPN